ncbi:MAG TPA: helix-turn-helix transcriptional regulator [Pyrinomonadaceae bacterium]|jgi:transcriptional regulator with XRE-family HTH domain
MGQSPRPVPARLAEKLLLIREGLRLSQNELIHRLALEDELTQARVSSYERGVREPPLAVLLRYARAANVSVDALIDDELDLPKRLPASPKSEGVRRKRASGAGSGGKRKPNRT